VLMLGCAVFILFQAVHHLRNPHSPEGTLPGILIFSVYSLIGFALWMKNRIALRTQHSAILQSQAHLWFSKAMLDALMASALILALVFSHQSWSQYLDPLAALIGVGFLIHGAWAVTSSSVGDLLDSTLEDSLQLRIMRDMVEHFDDYDRLHQIRTRRSGPRVYVEVFLQFASDLTMGEVQQRINRLRAAIAQSVPGAQIAIIPSDSAPGGAS